MRTLSAFGRVLRDLVRLTVLDPIRDGRPRTAGWPVGLRPIVFSTLAVYAVLTVAVIFAGPLRSNDTLLASQSGSTIPELGAVLVIGSVVLALALLVTAALHLPWWVKLAALMVTVNTALPFALPAVANPIRLVPVVVGIVVLAGLLIGRSWARYAWWEFVVVTLVLTGTLFLPWVGPVQGAVDFDWRTSTLEGSLAMVMTAATPALFVAGAALAQIAVTASFAGVSTSTRELGRRPLLMLVAVLVAGALASLVVAALDAENAPEAWVGATAQLLVLGLLALGVARLAGRPPALAELDEDSTRLNYLIAVACLSYLLVGPVFYLLREVARFAGMDWLFALTDGFTFLSRQDWFASLVRSLVGGVGLLAALRPSRRGTPWPAMFLGALTVLGLADLVRATGFIWLNDTVEQFSALLLVLLLGTAAALLLRGRLDVRAATALACGVVLCLIYPHRAILDDPISAALGFSGIGAVLFGLIWRLLTEADITREGTPKWPVPARVLLFCASALLGVSSTAYVALTRASGTQFDIALFSEAGDSLLGTPLFLTAVLGCLGIAVSRGRQSVAGGAAAGGAAAAAAPSGDGGHTTPGLFGS